MTSRLKRKLDDLGVDYTTRKANENFCLIGTPLPPLEKSKDAGEYVPLWKQDVRDEQGRRRLHGAFTGGWSAGYFNSVGSKEGWAPSTFVSSRGERAKAKAARPEDFMDEEDLQELRDSRQLVSTVEQSDLSGIFGAQKPSGDDEDVGQDPITQALQRTLHPPSETSPGVKLLKKMGWRPGQGVGPRVSFRERKTQDAEALDPTTGTRLLGDALDIPDDDEEAQKHTYPRRDTPILKVKRKDNFQGLGYVPGLSLNDQLGDSASNRGKGPQLAGGFGLGALNDADEDDLDVYDHTHPSKRSQKRVASDHSVDDDTITIGSKAEHRSAHTKHSSSAPQYFRDGTRVVPGFEVSNQPVQQDASFPWPEVPPGWKPDPRRVWAQEENKENTKVPPKAGPVPHHQWKSRGLTAGQRGAALGETPVAAPQRSIFDYISTKDKERLERAATQSSTLPSEAEAKSDGRPSDYSLPRLEPHIAQAALQGFQPFTTDAAKQARYTAFLLSQAAQDGSVPPLKALPTQSTQEYRKEIEDYAKAASLFKPISGAIASRFTTASVVEHEPEIREGLHQPSLLTTRYDVNKDMDMQTAEEERQRKEERLGPKAHAAKMGMYGAMTREVVVWIPTKLLCKRFGVKEPEVAVPTGDDSAGPTASTSGGLSYTPSAAEKELIASFSGSAAAGSGANTSAAGGVVGLGEGGRARNIENIGLGDDDSQGRDILTTQKPSMDVFKAIFASDEEDSDDDEDAQDDAGMVLDAPSGPGIGDKTASDTTTPGALDKPRFTPATAILEDAPFDPEAFKTMFKKKAKHKDGEDRSQEKKEKKEKKKKEKRGGLVSFQLDEEGAGEEMVKQPKDRPKKKRKKEQADADAAPTRTVAVSQVPPPLPLANAAPAGTVPAADSEAQGRFKGRKRAVDFLE